MPSAARRPPAIASQLFVFVTPLFETLPYALKLFIVKDDFQMP